MIAAMQDERFGSCTNHGECEAVCPKGIPMEFIGSMNHDLITAMFRRRRERPPAPDVGKQPYHDIEETGSRSRNK
jgi:succinate dehydrogenase / fumarate reductase iron-sulfur subunit